MAARGQKRPPEKAQSRLCPSSSPRKLIHRPWISLSQQLGRCEQRNSVTHRGEPSLLRRLPARGPSGTIGRAGWRPGAARADGDPPPSPRDPAASQVGSWCARGRSPQTSAAPGSPFRALAGHVHSGLPRHTARGTPRCWESWGHMGSGCAKHPEHGHPSSPPRVPTRSLLRGTLQAGLRGVVKNQGCATRGDLISIIN